MRIRFLCAGLALMSAAFFPRTLPAETTLTVGISQEFESMNPIVGRMMASTYIYYMVGRPLMANNAKWDWQCYLCTTLPTIENGLARIVEADGKRKIVAQWEIKPSARWGDGTPVTGKDLLLSWEIGLSPNVAVGLKQTYEQIESVTLDAENPKKFTLTFREARYDHNIIPTLYLVPEHLEGPLWRRTKDSQGAYEKQTLYATNPTNPGLYSGPYVIKEIRLGSHVVLERNRFFYGSPAGISKIVFKLIPNTQAIEANLLSGTIDMVSELGMSFDQTLSFEKRLERDPSLKARFRVEYRQGPTYEHIDLNLGNPILEDVRVRRALTHAVDREKLVQALFEGKQPAALHNVHPLDPWFTDDVPRYPYDPKRAEKLLEEAGWKAGSDGIRIKDGRRLSLLLMTTAENKTRELVQVFLQAEWKKVGVEIRIRNEPARVFFAETIRKALYPAMAMYAWTTSPDNPPRSTLHSEEIPTAQNGYSGQNSMGYSNASVDEALDRMVTEFDPQKRKDWMKIVQREYVKDVPVIPLYHRAQSAVVPSNMTGFEIPGHQFYSTLASENWALKR